MIKQIFTRSATALILAICLLTILFFGIVAIDVALVLLSCFLVYEFSSLAGFNKNIVVNIIAMLFSVSTIISVMFKLYWLIPILVFFVIMILFFATIINFGKTKFSYISQLFTMCIYICLTISSIHLIYSSFEYGKALIFLIFIASFVTDTGAYFIGIFFGKHRLIEKVSPKKSIEGAIGGIVFCVLGFVIFALITKYNYKIEYSYIKLITLAISSSVISQIGDLACSAIKREYEVKDFAKIFPGHGGFFDRVDSMLAVSPFIYMFLLYIGIFA